MLLNKLPEVFTHNSPECVADKQFLVNHTIESFNSLHTPVTGPLCLQFTKGAPINPLYILF